MGGQEVQAALLIRNWRGDPEAEVTFLPNDPVFPNWARALEGIPYLRTVIRLPLYAITAWHAISRVEVVHIFSASYTSFLLTCFPVWSISRWKRKRVVLNYHTARRWRQFATSRIVRFVLNRTQKIVVPSTYLARKFEEIGFNVSIVPNIINDRFQYRARTPLKPRILCTRNLSPDYGVDVVIDVFSIVQAQCPEAELCLIGDGPLRGCLEAKVRSLGISNVQFCGRVANDQMPEWYDRTDIFLNASLLDNAPLSILEAFACGLPVVTTAAGGIPLMAHHEETGLLAPVGDRRTLAECVLRLLRETEFAEKIARQAHEQLAAHRWSVVRLKWLGVYRACAGGA